MVSECEGCGAPIKPHRHNCEYCRRYFSPAPHSDEYRRSLAAQRAVAYDYNAQYDVGGSDPRNMYGPMMGQSPNAWGSSQNQNNWWSGIGGLGGYYP